MLEDEEFIGKIRFSTSNVCERENKIEKLPLKRDRKYTSQCQRRLIKGRAIFDMRNHAKKATSTLAMTD